MSGNDQLSEIERHYAGPITFYKAAVYDHGMGRFESILFSIILTIATGGLVWITEYEPMDMHMLAEGIDLD